MFKILLVLLTYFVLRSDSKTAEETARELLHKAAKAFAKHAGEINVNLGITSRSIGLIKIYYAWYSGEDFNAESFWQTFLTLTLLDINFGKYGGRLDGLIKDFAQEKALEATKKSLKSNNVWKNYIETKTKAVPGDNKEIIKDAVKKDIALKKLNEKHIRKTKRIFKVSKIGIYGPIGDLASIVINGWALGTLIRDCFQDRPNCDYVSMTAASFSILSSLVGFGSFLKTVMGTAIVAGPGAPIAAAILGITATVFELISHYQSFQRLSQKIELTEKLSEQLDNHAKVQLFNFTKAPPYKTFHMDEMDVYVIHQGHLLDMEDNRKRSVEFGANENEQPRKWYTKHRVTCSNPIEKKIVRPPTKAINKLKCHYLVQRDDFKDGSRTNARLGFSFYGFARNFTEHSDETEHAPPYNGAAVLITTDMLQRDEECKGLKIFTYTNETHSFDDFLSIGDMPCLDTRVPEGIVEIKTGNGNDILNIEGHIGRSTSSNVLQADLGEGQNVLSFEVLNGSNTIKGIVFNATTGDIYYIHDLNTKQHVGYVKNVTSLIASPFFDEIHLDGKRKSRPSDTDDHDFIVSKLKGLAKYKIDVSLLPKQNEPVRFLIWDNTMRILAQETPMPPPFVLAYGFGTKSVGRTCDQHEPTLQLLNLQTGEKPIYKNDKIIVPGKRKIRASPVGHTNERITLAIIEIRSVCDVQIQATDRSGDNVIGPCLKHELNTRDFDGSKLLIDFTKKTYDGTEKDDYAILKCPLQTTTGTTEINFGKGKADYLVIGENSFFEPCDIDPDGDSMTLTSGGDNIWELHLRGVNQKKFAEGSHTIRLRGLDEFLDEYGNVVLQLNDQTASSVDLYEKYNTSRPAIP